MKIEVHAASAAYPIYMERGILNHAKEYIGREGHVFIVSDDGVPKQYQNILHQQYPEAGMYVFENGEPHKNFDTLQEILKAMQEAHLSRKDTVIALGGGVVGRICCGNLHAWYSLYQYPYNHTVSDRFQYRRKDSH